MLNNHQLYGPKYVVSSPTSTIWAGEIVCQFDGTGLTSYCEGYLFAGSVRLAMLRPWFLPREQCYVPQDFGKFDPFYGLVYKYSDGWINWDFINILHIYFDINISYIYIYILEFVYIIDMMGAMVVYAHHPPIPW